jgi:hypothetical protein
MSVNSVGLMRVDRSVANTPAASDDGVCSSSISKSYTKRCGRLAYIFPRLFTFSLNITSYSFSSFEII